MKILVWVLVAIGAIVVVGGLVLPLVGWALHALGWLIAPLVVIGGGIWVATKIRDGRATVKAEEATVTRADGQPLV